MMTNKVCGLLMGVILGLIPYSVAISDITASSLGSLAKNVTILVGLGAQGSKSGVIIDRRGNTYFVLTTKRSMSENGSYYINTPNGELLKLDYSKVIKLPDLDLAIFQFTSPNNYDFVKFGNPETVKEGDTVYVVGIPSSQASDSVRVVTAQGKVTEFLDRPLDGGYRWIYDNKTEEGMSGGAVLDVKGNVVGIHGQAQGRKIAINSKRTGKLEMGFNLGIPIDSFFKEGVFSQSPSIPSPTVAIPTPEPTPSVVIAPKPAPSVVITPKPTLSVVIRPKPTSSVVITPKPTPSVVIMPKPAPPVVITPKPTPSVVITPKPTPSVVVTPKPTPSVVVTPKPAPSVVITPTLKPTPLIETRRLPPSPTNTVLFMKPPLLVEASTTQDSTSTPGATYYFTVSVPQDAGASLSEIQFQQTSGSNFLGYNIEETKGFEGTRNDRNAEVFVSLVDENSDNRTISVRLNPPIAPGKTVTLALRPLQTPASRGVYQLSLTAFPDGKSARPFPLGSARLNFYNRK